MTPHFSVIVYPIIIISVYTEEYSVVLQYLSNKNKLQDQGHEESFDALNRKAYDIAKKVNDNLNFGFGFSWIYMHMKYLMTGIP